MKRKEPRNDPEEMDRKRDADDSSRTDDMRQANENVRKAQGEDSTPDRSFEGRKPAIDRDR